MKKFTDFGITIEKKGFTGDKIKIERLLNREIVVHAYEIKPSKFEGKDKCLHLQISLNGTMHVVFIGSKSLMEIIEKVPKEDFPFETTIVKPDQQFIFS